MHDQFSVLAQRLRDGKSPEVMRLIDDLHNEAGESPCLEASTDNVMQVDNDIAESSPWPG